MPVYAERATIMSDAAECEATNDYYYRHCVSVRRRLPLDLMLCMLISTRWCAVLPPATNVTCSSC